MDTNTMPLSDTALRKIKVTDRDQKLFDGGGLHFFVSKRGGRSWRLSYRFHGKQKTLTLGKYPAVSLADARRRRDEAKAVLAGGDDPGEIKRLEKLARSAAAENAFGVIADEYVVKLRKEGRAGTTVKKVAWASRLCPPRSWSSPNLGNHRC